MTKNCEANHTLWAVPVCLDAAAHVRRVDEEPLEGESCGMTGIRPRICPGIQDIYGHRKQ